MNQCPDPRCGSFTGHSIWCRTLSAEKRADKAYKAYQALQKEMEHRLHQRDHTIQRLKEKVTLWQGKHRIVCHENNQLRKKREQ